MHPSASRIEGDSTKLGPQGLRRQVGPISTLVPVTVHEPLPHVGAPRGSQDLAKLVCLLARDRPPKVETVACRMPEEPGPRRLPLHAHEYTSQDVDWVPSASTPPIDGSRVSRDDRFQKMLSGQHLQVAVPAQEAGSNESVRSLTNPIPSTNLRKQTPSLLKRGGPRQPTVGNGRHGVAGDCSVKGLKGQPNGSQEPKRAKPLVNPLASSSVSCRAREAV